MKRRIGVINFTKTTYQAIVISSFVFNWLHINFLVSLTLDLWQREKEAAAEGENTKTIKKK